MFKHKYYNNVVIVVIIVIVVIVVITVITVITVIVVVIVAVQFYIYLLYFCIFNNAVDIDLPIVLTLLAASINSDISPPIASII